MQALLTKPPDLPLTVWQFNIPIPFIWNSFGSIPIPFIYTYHVGAVVLLKDTLHSLFIHVIATVATHQNKYKFTDFVMATAF